MSTTKKQNIAKKANRRRNRRRNANKPSNADIQSAYAGILARKGSAAPAMGGKRKRNRRGKRNGKNGGMRTRNLPVSNNQRRFIVPIDEQIQLVSGTVAFAQITFAANPGNATLFPFLSRVAQNYERYEFEDLCFEYRPSASVFATVGAQGFVGVSATDDALQAPPSSQQIAEVYLHSPIVETAKPTSLCLKKQFMESSTKQLHFVRPNGLIPGGGDPHLYDAAQFFFWTSGQANTNQIGEIRVTGKCLLCNPVLETSTNPAPQFQVGSFQQPNTTTNLATTVSTILPLATVGAIGLVIPNNAGTFTPPVGNYLITAMVNFLASGNVTQFNANIQKNAALIPAAGLGNDSTLPSAAYPAWSAPIPPVFVSCNGTDTITLNAQTVFSTGAVTAGGYVTFEVI